MAKEREETANERYQRVLRELRAIAENPNETSERRARARQVIADLTRGSRTSPSLESKKTGEV